MKADIFESCLKLKLKNSQKEELFQSELIEEGSKYSNFLLLLNFVLLLLLILGTQLFKSAKNDSFYKQELKVSFWLSIFFLICLVIITILKFACNRFKQIVQASIIISYFISSCIFIMVRYLIFYSNITNEFIHVSFYIDFLFKFIWLELSIVDFWVNFSINIFLFLFTKLLEVIFFKWKSETIIYILVGDVLKFTSIVFGYFILKKKRSISYYFNTLKANNQWYKSVLDNINSGFLKITNKKLTFLNKCVLDICYRRGSIAQNPKEIDDVYEIIEDINNKVLNDIATITMLSNCTNKQVPYIMVRTDISNCSSSEDNNNLHVSSTESNSDKIEYFFTHVQQSLVKLKKANEQFAYIGNALVDFNDEGDYNYYELYGRFYTNEKGENLEMILNDVTRTKIEQEKNAEIRYKSVLLSKLAHEFKNPLICLTEIVEEELEKLKIKDNNLNLIKSITNYLLILIKDIDMFSQIQKQLTNKGEEIKLSLIKVNLFEITSFVKMIAKYLLKKTVNKVTFDLNIATNIPQDIITDEIKLKQILINLISNSVKFTKEGTITLSIEMDYDTISFDEKDKDKFIKFTVSDTGIGIPKENQTQLFKAFSKAKNTDNINKFGAGLGLAITSEITKKIGKQIQFESSTEKGSKFWFSVRTNLDSLNALEESSDTIKVQDINLNTMRNEISLNRPTLDIAKEIENKKKVITIVLGDDELLIRNAMKRIILDYGKVNGIDFEIIEASDGVEILWNVFFYYTKAEVKKKIDVIISDENMMMLSGKKTSVKLVKMEKIFHYEHVPFFLSSAYSSMSDDFVGVDGIIHKPLISTDLDDILKSIK